MMTCRKARGHFIEALYEGPGPQVKDEFYRHLDSCRDCNRAFRSLQGTLDKMSQRGFVDPGQEYWDNYFNNLEQRLAGAVRSGRRFQLPRIPRPAVYRLLSSAAVLLIGFLLGYLYFSQTRPPVVPRADSQEQQQAVVRRAADYLEQSRVLLLGIVNMDTNGPVGWNLSNQQAVSRSLLQQSADLKDELKRAGDQRVLDLLSELEVIIMQISNYEQQFDAPAIELIRSSVDDQGILLKIDLERLLLSRREYQEGSTKPAEGAPKAL